MGPAHSTIVNNSSKNICAITFNNPDLLYKSYQTMYIIEPGQSCVVEAMPDAVGLKVGIIYQTSSSTQELFYARYFCKNETQFNINLISEHGEISYFGDGINPIGKGTIKESDTVPFEMAEEAIGGKVRPGAPAAIKKAADLSVPGSSSTTALSAMDGGGGGGYSLDRNNKPAAAAPVNSSFADRGGGNNRGVGLPSRHSEDTLSVVTPRVADFNNSSQLQQQALASSSSANPIENAVEKVTSAIGNLDTQFKAKAKNAFAKLDPKYKEKEAAAAAAAAAEKKKKDDAARKKYEDEQRVAKEKWESDLKRAKDSARQKAEQEAELRAIKKLDALVKEQEDVEAAELANREAVEVDEVVSQAIASRLKNKSSSLRPAVGGVGDREKDYRQQQDPYGSTAGGYGGGGGADLYGYNKSSQSPRGGGGVGGRGVGVGGADYLYDNPMGGGAGSGGYNNRGQTGYGAAAGGQYGGVGGYGIGSYGAADKYGSGGGLYGAAAAGAGPPVVGSKGCGCTVM